MSSHRFRNKPRLNSQMFSVTLARSRDVWNAEYGSNNVTPFIRPMLLTPMQESKRQKRTKRIVITRGTGMGMSAQNKSTCRALLFSLVNGNHLCGRCGLGNSYHILRVKCMADTHLPVIKNGNSCFFFTARMTYEGIICNFAILHKFWFRFRFWFLI